MTDLNPNPTVEIDSTTEESRSINMEQNHSTSTTTTAASAKKFWRMVKAVYIMLRKGISKGKLMMDLKLMIIKRNNKLSGKLHRLSSAVHRRTHDHDYPEFHLPFYKKCSNENEAATFQAVIKGLEESMPASPLLPGFGKTPMGRELRITDSPFCSSDVVNEDESHIDEAAEEFINKFYSDLRRRNAMASDSS